MVQDHGLRKGPWTEQEDMRLLLFVGILGERRWDLIAKVSGLNRTGKSCRLRWVNYLHPGLKRGRMTPQEERLVLDLHAKWGNRWSRIARKLPGRTDNEIKNYWRTHMRKKAQERKRMMMPPPSSSSMLLSSISTSSSKSQTQPPLNTLPTNSSAKDDAALSTTAGKDCSGSKITTQGEEESEEDQETNGYYSMEKIWKEIDSLSAKASTPEIILDAGDGGCKKEEWDSDNLNCTTMPSPLWDYSYYDSPIGTTFSCVSNSCQVDSDYNYL